MVAPNSYIYIYALALWLESEKGKKIFEDQAKKWYLKLYLNMNFTWKES